MVFACHTIATHCSRLRNKIQGPQTPQVFSRVAIVFSRRLFIHAKVFRDIFGPRIQGMEYRAGSHIFGYPEHGSTKTFQVYTEESDSLAHLSKYIATICYRFFEVAGRYCDWVKCFFVLQVCCDRHRRFFFHTRVLHSLA